MSFDDVYSLQVLNDNEKESDSLKTNTTVMAFVTVLAVVLIIVARISFVFFKRRNGQKTRDPQRNRMYGGSRSRPSLSQPTPSIYVSPANLPPPPKYEFMPPPSYEEVVGVHPPSFAQQCGVASASSQPITLPITDAIASSSPNNQTNTDDQSPSSGNQATNPDNQATSPDNQSTCPVNQTEQPGTSAQATTTVTITSETAKSETAINVSS